MTTPIESGKDDPTQWPPPPHLVPKSSEADANRVAQAKVFAGAAWADSLLGSLASLLSFTLLTFIIANPLMWRVAPNVVPENWSSQRRLLIGWSLACVVQATAWVFFRRRNYNALSRSILATSIPVAASWLLIILVTCWLFG